MLRALSGVRVAVLGGDRREVELVAGLLGAGANVRMVGYPSLAELSGATSVSTVQEAVEGAHVLIAPMTGTDDAGRIRSVLRSDTELYLNRTTLARVTPGTPLLIGYAKPFVRQLATGLSLRLVELAELDHIAILNSIPTAEGAIQLVMERMPITVHGSRCVVIGFGRCGMTLARDLAALGAKTQVLARSGAQLARAEEMGLTPVPLDACDDALAAADCVFNTVPSLVLPRERLARIRTDAIIIDLASAPGGVDYAAAEEFGVTAILALGLPGKVAPKTSGRILARHVPDLVADLIGDHVGKDGDAACASKASG